MIQDTLFSKSSLLINSGGIERVKRMHIYECNVILCTYNLLLSSLLYFTMAICSDNYYYNFTYLFF